MASTDSTDPRSRKLLEDAGFKYDSRLGVWLNVAAARAISFDTVRDRSPEWLAEWLAQRRE
jgi:hypothetical protein